MTAREQGSGFGWLPLLALIAIVVVGVAASRGGTDREPAAAEPPPRSSVDPPAVVNSPPAEREAERPAPVAGARGVLVEVVRVVDGDSIHVQRDGQRVKLRVIGLDTPEVGDCWRDESSARAEELLDGETIRIAPDPSQDKVDRYGRELHDVWLPDGRLYAAVMVAEGEARAYVYDEDDPPRFADELAAAEGKARAADAGLWGTCRRVTDR